MGNGGYVEYWNMSNLVEETTMLVKDDWLDASMWMLAIEFATYEVDTKFHVYNAISFILTDKGEIVRKFEAFPLYFREFSTAFGVGVTLLEVLVVIFLVFYMINYLTGFVTRWKDYDAWIETELPYMSNMEIFQRREKCPELIRKLKYVFNTFRILDLLFFAFTTAGIVCWIIYFYDTRSLLMVFESANIDFPTEYLTLMRYAYESLSEYVDYNSIALIVFALRLMEYLHYAGGMKVLTSTIARSFEDIVYFFLMFMVLIMGFAAMANVVFGEVDSNFGTFGDSIISCLLIPLGEFDISGLQKERTLTSLFFIFFFLILFTYVVLNILLAILEINFSEVKQEMARQDEKVRKLNVLMCCCLKLPQEKPQGKERAREKVDLRTGLALLDRMDIYLNTTSTSIRWWADSLAQQIFSETKMRKEFRKNVQSKIYKVSTVNIGNENDEDAREAIRERKNYLHYLKTSTQFMSYQYLAIGEKLKSVDAMMQNEYDIFMREKEEYYKGENVKVKISEQLKLRKKEINDRILEHKENNKLNMITITESFKTVSCFWKRLQLIRPNN
eukprot:TRINITY_DN7421_c0_g2_i1.p1 TRINITY_DN7421_c0_g2~~TRINITY_DN7421_c0_g2_i1.p1  ORF type:complete len:569 (-),score=155.80 TRINITY_DN7421_c0_g2_i1:59-1735(-)